MGMDLTPSLFPPYTELSIQQQVLSSDNWSSEFLCSQQHKKSIVLLYIPINNPSITILATLTYAFCSGDIRFL